MTQYDLEIWLRIEAALGKKVEEYQTERDEVMIFRRRVEEGCRHARTEMNNQKTSGSTHGARSQRIGKHKSRNGGGNRSGDRDREEQ